IDGIKTPVGVIPKYEDLKKLFSDVLDKEYSMDSYIEQFTLRVPENLAKLQRMADIYKTMPDTPEVLLDLLKKQEDGLKGAAAKHGDYILPQDFS
ncbi:phosphoenolpyruvate carboxykinase domain-containing protein, partial [Elusimicrobiota bacterium]